MAGVAMSEQYNSKPVASIRATTGTMLLLYPDLLTTSIIIENLVKLNFIC